MGGAIGSVLKNPNTYKGIANVVAQPDGTPQPSRTAGILNTVGNVGDVMNAVGANRAAGREAAAIANQNQARAAADIFRTRMDASLRGPELSARQTALGDTMANVKPFTWTGDTKMVGNIPVPQSSGGLTPANLGPATRQAGADLARVASSRVTSPVFNLPEVPVLPDLPQAGTTDSILNKVGPIASLVGAFGDRFTGGGRPSVQPRDKSILDDPNTFVGPTRPGDIRNPDTFVGPVRPAEDVTAGLDPSLLPGDTGDPVDAYLKWLYANHEENG